MNHVNFVCGNIINDGTTVLGERFKDTLNHAEYALKGHETLYTCGGSGQIRPHRMDKSHFIWNGNQVLKGGMEE